MVPIRLKPVRLAALGVVGDAQTSFWVVLPVTKMVTLLIFALFCPQTFEVAAKRACFDCLGQARGAETMSGTAERLGIHP